FFSSRRRHTRSYGDWSSDVCSSDLEPFRRGVRRKDQVDLNRHGGRRRNDGRLRVREEGLGHGRKGGALEPLELVSGRIEDSDARSEERRVGKEWKRRGRTDQSRRSK